MTEMERMQAEAVNSARAMYRRRTPARSVPVTTVPPAAGSSARIEKTEQPIENADSGSISTDEQSARQPGLLERLFDDKEKTLIILLIILLSEDGADPAVIMALMYTII